MKTIRVVGVGFQPAKPAGEIKIGDVLIGHYGWKSQVLEIIKETKTQIIFLAYSEASQMTHVRRYGKDTLVAFNEGRSLL